VHGVITKVEFRVIAMSNVSDRFFSQLKSPRLFYEQLLDTFSDLVFCVKDNEGRYIVVNDSFLLRVDARSKNAVLGKTAFDLFPKRLAERYHTQDQDVLRNGREINDCIDMTVYPNGSLGWCLTSKLPIRDGFGEIIGLITISKDLNMATQHDAVSSKFTETIDYIQNSFNEHLEIKTLATMACMTVSQFQRRMKMIYRMTVWQFIQKTRVNEVARLLKNSEIPMSQIAFRCGFCDQSALTRRFKESTGYTPREYRQRFRK